MDRRLAAECEQRPGNCGAATKRIDCVSRCEHGHGPHLVVSCPAIRNVVISRTYIIIRLSGSFEREEKWDLRDKISESLIRMLSGISEAIFDLISKLRRSWPCTSCFPMAPDPSRLRSAMTVLFLFSISSDPMRRIFSNSRPRTRERRVGCRRAMPFVCLLSTVKEEPWCLRCGGR